MTEKIMVFCCIAVLFVILCWIIPVNIGKDMVENRQPYRDPFKQYAEKYHRLCKLKEAGVKVPVGTIATEHRGINYVLNEDFGLGVLYSSGSAIPMQKISIGVTDYYVATTRKGRP